MTNKPDAAPALVDYTVNPDGTETITLTGEWNDNFRFDNFPHSIRAEARETFPYVATETEVRRLRLAFDLGEPLYSAVWDDIMSRRADAIVAERKALKLLDPSTKRSYPSVTPEQEMAR